MALAEASRQATPPQRPTPFTSAGRHAIGARALNHPVRTVLVVYLVSRRGGAARPVGRGHVVPEPGGRRPRRPRPRRHLRPVGRRLVRADRPRRLPRAPAGRRRQRRGHLQRVGVLPALPLPREGASCSPGCRSRWPGSCSTSCSAASRRVLIWAVLRSGVHADRQPQRERLALVAACLWCFYPTTAVMLKPYTEALAVVLVAGALLLLVRRRYLLVAAVALPLGFTRGVAPALGCAALIHLVVRWREDRAAGIRPLDGQRASAVVMLAALAVSAVAWPVVAGLVTGVPTAFFDVQAAWGQRPDKGPFVLWIEWAWQGKGVAGVVVLVVARRHLRRARPRPARPLDLASRRGPGRWPTRSTSSRSSARSRACGASSCSTSRSPRSLASVAMRTANGQSVVPHWRRRVAVVLARRHRRARSGGPARCSSTPRGARSRPDRRRSGADFFLSHGYGIMEPPFPTVRRRAPRGAHTRSRGEEGIQPWRQ